MTIDADDEFVDESSNDQVFQPFPDPDDPDFDLLFERNVFHIVRVWQIHSRKHTPTCFKYRFKKCRFRFPRTIVVKMRFDEATGVIYIKREVHSYCYHKGRDDTGIWHFYRELKMTQPHGNEENYLSKVFCEQ